jgi:predicted patatin/cPLA2 family phospholipase
MPLRRLVFPVALAGLMLAGCCATPRKNCVPSDLAMARLHDATTSPDDEPVHELDAMAIFKEAMQRERSAKPAPNRKPQNYLALSGGGVYGAFTVGVLNGWTESGTRPQFDVVTGISTGALIATFAFLGPEYDEVIRAYTLPEKTPNLYKPRRPLSLIYADSLVTVEPLKRMIEAAITPDVLCEVAAAHAAGRRLYVGTTNLDSRRLVIWDMGAIASSNRSDALKLYRDVILASSAVPGVFPPVYMDVEIDGQHYREMHVDGGVTSAVFFQPFMLNADKNDVRSRSESNLYVIEAGKIYADPQCVEPRFFKIAGSTVRAMLYTIGRNDVYRIYTLALITGVNFHLAAVPQDFPMNLESLKPDVKEMRKLYDLGVSFGRNNQEWLTKPSDTGVDENILPRSGLRLTTK